MTYWPPYGVGFIYLKTEELLSSLSFSLPQPPPARPISKAQHRPIWEEVWVKGELFPRFSLTGLTSNISNQD